MDVKDIMLNTPLVFRREVSFDEEVIFLETVVFNGPVNFNKSVTFKKNVFFNRRVSYDSCGQEFTEKVEFRRETKIYAPVVFLWSGDYVFVGHDAHLTDRVMTDQEFYEKYHRNLGKW